MERQSEHRNDKGFGDEAFVLIRSHHWKSNVNRRPILLQAWIAEFADILLNEVILCQIPSIRRSNNTDPLVNSLVNKGACDIVKYLENTPTFLQGFTLNERDQAINELKSLRQKRNDGTHGRIGNSNLLMEILQLMTKFCSSFANRNFATESFNSFVGNCVTEQEHMTTMSHLY